MTVYRIRTPKVVHESVAGEVVAIDFDSGSYFSLRGPAEAVWSALSGDEGRAVDKAAGAVADVDADAVAGFLDHLVELGLLERTGPPAGSGSVTGTGALVVEQFTDMEDLILLDPVHDVSDAGWPNAPT
jgi:hypothetical protein